MGTSIKRSARDDQPSFIDNGWDSKIVALSKVVVNYLLQERRIDLSVHCESREQGGPHPRHQGCGHSAAHYRRLRFTVEVNDVLEVSRQNCRIGSLLF